MGVQINIKMCIVLAVLLIIICITLLGIGLSHGGDVEDEEIPESEYISVIMARVTDYAGGKRRDVLEVIYHTYDKQTKVYKNGILTDKDAVEFSFGAGEELLELQLTDVKNDKGVEVEVDIDEYKTGSDYIYHIGLDDSSKYIESLLGSDYSNLLRAVNTPKYCETYLSNLDGTIKRIIQTQSRMIIADLKNGVQLKDIDTYFIEESGGLEDED